MQQYNLLLLLVAALLHTTTSTVYYVTPDNHYYPINDNTHTLRHYLNNTNKYFTSNTQLHFLPGQYYLNNDLMIQGVSNFTFIGNRINEVINTVINCTLPAGIVVVDSSNIVIANIVMNECGNYYAELLNDHSFERKNDNLISLLFIQSKIISCTYFHTSEDAGGIEFINPLVTTQISNLITNTLKIFYNKHADNANHIFEVNNLQFYNSNIYAVQIKQFNISANVNVIIQYVNFTNTLALYVICVNCTSHSSIIITHCNFTSIDTIFYDYDNDYDIDYDYDYNDDEFYDYAAPVYDYNNDNNFTHSNSTVYAYYQDCGSIHASNNIQFIDCYFINNIGLKELIQIHQRNIHNDHLVNLSATIIRCTFHNNQYVQILVAVCYNDDESYCILLLIKDTIISFNTQFQSSLMYSYKAKTEIEQITAISNVGVDSDSSIFNAEESYLQFGNYNEIFNNTLTDSEIITASLIHIQENTVINVTLNTVFAFMYSFIIGFQITCPIQYISRNGNLDQEFQRGDKLNYSLIFHNNNMSWISNRHMIHCTWISNSAFLTTRPILAYRRFIAYNFSDEDDNYKTYLCDTNKQNNCHNEDYGPFYPGQTIKFDFVLADNTKKEVLVSTSDLSDFICIDQKIEFKLQYDEHKIIKQKVMYNYREWCDLLLKVLIVHSQQDLEIGIQAYTILLLPCPQGFSLNMEEYCQCDIILSSHISSLTHCNIDDQTIPRPANSWISAHTVNNSHSYLVSLHCPFDYCLPHSSHLNLSTPDSQCQFNRSGLLCGQCQQGLSAVFGSSKCKRCSNVYLLIIIPIAVAGVILVLLLFVLNLTITDGDINAVLFYANIISINTPIFFPNNHSISYVLISLLNLDLGIETCFYSGMDDLAKKVLQLVFPIYLILIATFIIILSHYSGRMQRLTARKGLKVLATLFLLSYTKTLLAVSNVLFFYSTITHLPSNDTTIVWSVDANVPLFGIYFTVLFIICLLIFALLIPFNMLLIFTRILSRFRVVNYFKPILDAYQGPYKIKFYYWTGLQLLMRAVFFGLSGLERSTNVIASTILLGVMIWIYDKASPFNKKLNNIIEILSLINLQALFIISYILTSASDIAIDILILLEMFQLVCIIIMHLKMATCPSYPVNFNFNITNGINKYFDFKQHSQKDQREEINLEAVGSSPLVDYKEFREPLIGPW